MLGRSNIFCTDLYNEKKLSRDTIEKYRIRIDVGSKNRISFATGSSGNQRKWVDNNKRFVKLNCLGYEDISEICACWLFKHIMNLDFTFVKYYPCFVYEDGIRIGNGVFSYNYTENCEEITFKDILQDNLQSFAIEYDDIFDLINDLYDYDVRSYLDAKACLDAMTRNEDSHWGNFAILINNITENVEPIIFDYGDAFMSDCVSYPLGCNLDIAFNNLKAKPFKLNFEDQINKYCKRMCLDFNELVKSIDCNSTDPEFSRAVQVMMRALQISKNIAWEDI